MVYVEVIGQPIIILNSVKVAKDLLDKRSLIYSNRPRLVSISVYSLFQAVEFDCHIDNGRAVSLMIAYRRFTISNGVRH
jgi:hypothetical protein